MPLIENVSSIDLSQRGSGAVRRLIWRTVRSNRGAAGEVAGVVPANAYGCLNLVLEGRPTSAKTALPECFVTGPLTVPLHTAVSGPLRSLSVVIQPWLLSDWFGVWPAAMVDRWLDVPDLSDVSDVGSALHKALGRLAEQPPKSDGDLSTLLKIPARRTDQIGAWLAIDVLEDAGVAAAAGRLLLSQRQYQRRFSACFGVAPRTWLRLRQSERALLSLANHANPFAPLAAMAQDHGFSDQAHFTRACTGAYGMPPATTRAQLRSRRTGHWALHGAQAASFESHVSMRREEEGCVQD